MAERCVCGHDFWDHEIEDLGEMGGDEESYTCTGDLGGCKCEEFTYLGEEDEE